MRDPRSRNRRSETGARADARSDRSPTLTIEIHSDSSEACGRISTSRCGCGPVDDPRTPLECTAFRISRDALKVRTRQVSRAIGRRRSPFQRTAFFVVGEPGCPHPASRIGPHEVALTGEMHSVPSGSGARISTTAPARRFAVGASATSVHGPAGDRRQMPESPANSASGGTLTVRIHSISSEPHGRLSTSAPQPAAPASALTRQSNG